MSTPIIIRDIVLIRWNWDGRYLLNRDKFPEDNLTPLFVPESDVLRFVVSDFWDRPKGRVDADYHAAIRFTESRVQALRTGHRMFVCDQCKQWAGDCSGLKNATRCLGCQESKDEWRRGRILRNELVKDEAGTVILTNSISEANIEQMFAEDQWAKTIRESEVV